MRWDALFEDLESQLHSESVARQESEIRDRTRSEQSRVTLVQRLQGQRGGRIGVVTGGGRQLSGILTTVGAQWIALESEGRFIVVPLSSVQLFRGLPAKPAQLNFIAPNAQGEAEVHVERNRTPGVPPAAKKGKRK